MTTRVRIRDGRLRERVAGSRIPVLGGSSRTRKIIVGFRPGNESCGARRSHLFFLLLVSLHAEGVFQGINLLPVLE
jgi:hypothetical protein